MASRATKRAESALEQALAVDYAYQPIISTSSLRAVGFEALARPRGGFADICSLLDAAFADGTLLQVERLLLGKALGKYAACELATQARLFCNVDPRVYADSLPSIATVDALTSASGLPPGSLCFEISERASPQAAQNMLGMVDMLRMRQVQIAIDDFGIGMSGLHSLLTVDPHYIKIDQCFIAGLAGSPRKQAIVAKLCGLAHALGSLSIAEGVETEADFRAARDLGCDLAQGYYIARPTVTMPDLAMSYGRTVEVLTSLQMNRRVAELLSPITPLFIDEPLTAAARLFREQPDVRLVPIVDRAGMVQGGLREEELRRYLLSDFGPSLLANKGMPSSLLPLMRRCPVADAYAGVDVIVNSYVAAESADGLILASAGHYIGYLTNHAIVRLAAETEVSAAREQNPLTHLPGNQAVATHIAEAGAADVPQSLVYFDFDNFKAFNDTYGFSSGDRVLLIFAQLLRQLQAATGAFIGHLGGDDFFVGMTAAADAAEATITELCAKFASGAESLYTPDDRARGGIVAIDRFGAKRFFPLLRVSAAVLHLAPASGGIGVGEAAIHDRLATCKLAAKRAGNGIVICNLSTAAAYEPVRAAA